MLVSQGEKFHVVMRRAYEGQVRRHFIGQADAVTDAVVRATGYVFIYEDIDAQYIKKETPRTTILDLAESGYIVNFIPQSVNIDDLRYEIVDQKFLVVTDGKGFILDINEFGPNR
jgi:hypothetical protein